MTALLSIDTLRKEFEGLVALDGVSFSVPEGTITALIGPNGAGKTTCLNLVSGMLPPTSGTILFQGCSIVSEPAHRIAELGIARTFQQVELFSNMSVIENVMVGRHLRSTGGLFSVATRLGGTPATERRLIADGLHYLEMVQLTDCAYLPAGDLPFGKQRLLEIARALAVEPKLLLLDEAASGLSTQEKQDLVDLIFRIRAGGVTIFLVDHDMDLVMDISDKVVVLDHGLKIAEDTPAAVQRDAQVITAYLGEEVVNA